MKPEKRAFTAGGFLTIRENPEEPDFFCVHDLWRTK
jgi:hypothetical protein